MSFRAISDPRHPQRQPQQNNSQCTIPLIGNGNVLDLRQQSKKNGSAKIRSKFKLCQTQPISQALSDLCGFHFFCSIVYFSKTAVRSSSASQCLSYDSEFFCLKVYKFACPDASKAPGCHVITGGALCYAESRGQAWGIGGMSDPDRVLDNMTWCVGSWGPTKICRTQCKL